MCVGYFEVKGFGYEQAGYDYDEETFEKVFRRIYSTFGSAAPYSVFQDSRPFLRWAREKGLIVGLVSNAEYRYQEVILPALGLNKVVKQSLKREGLIQKLTQVFSFDYLFFFQGEWDFGVFSGMEGIEKPDPRIYKLALERAGNNIRPEEVLHIGDSMRKDYVPAKSTGMHALLLDRFKTEAAKDWREAGAVVLPDLVAVQQLLESDKLKC